MGKRVESPTEGKEMICCWKPFNIQVIFVWLSDLAGEVGAGDYTSRFLKKQLKQMAYVSRAQTVSTIWLKQCTEELLNQEANYLPILEADHVRMILASTATPPICTHRHTNLDPIPIVLCRRISIYGNSFAILNFFVVSLNLLQMNRMFLKVPYPACPLQFLASLLRTSPNIQSENDWKSRSSYLILVTTGKLSLPRSRFCLVT